MSKKMFFGVLFAVFVSGLLIAGINFNVTKAVAYSSSGTSVIGIIGKNTTWTKENSPYNLTGPVRVNTTVTLTIEPGVIVNLNSYYIQVYGSLIARGNSTDPICFNGGQITGVNCIIENSILHSTSTQGAKSLINNIIINAEVDGGSIISNTIINAKVSGSPIISNTIINGEISVMLGGAGVVISNNTITNPRGSGISCNGYAYISDNVIYGCKTGINGYTITLIIGGDVPADPTIERNQILNNNVGIAIDLYRRFEPGTSCPTILNNTISKNSIGIYLEESNYVAAPTILYNNIQNNSNYNFYLQASVNVNATYNWWGTTDIPSINQSIFDFKNDFNLGKVNFIPFLTAPNPAAPTDKTAPSVGIPLRIPEGDVQPGQEVKVSVNATDTLSYIKNVTLSYNLNNGDVWVNLLMTYNPTTGLYETTIQIQQANTHVKYKIIAYDNAGNHKVEDNSGEYYIYTVIPEFPSFLILPLFMIATLLIAIIYRRKHIA